MATHWSKLIPELISIKECFFGGFLECRVTIPWWGGENLSALPFRNELIWIAEACNDPPAVPSLLLTFKTHFKDLRCCICKCLAIFTTKLFSTPTMLIRKPQIHYVSASTFARFCLLSRSKKESWWKPAHVAKTDVGRPHSSSSQIIRECHREKMWSITPSLLPRQGQAILEKQGKDGRKGRAEPEAKMSRSISPCDQPPA